MARFEEEQSNFRKYYLTGNKKCVVFVHGLSGDHDDYWCDLPKIIQQNKSLMDFDLIFWSYPTSKNPFANLWHWLAGKKAIPSPDTVGRELSGFLSSQTAEYRYEQIQLFGHSLGGIISLLAALDFKENKGFDSSVLSSVHLDSSPTGDVPQARLYYWLFGRTNPQISLFANTKKLQMKLRNQISSVRSGDVWVSFAHHTSDNLARWPELNFDETTGQSGDHMWFQSKANATDTNLKVIAHWIKSGRLNA